MHLMDYEGNEVKAYGICCGKNYGDKQVIGDMKTPEGIFRITDVEDASTWGHDFKDGKGRIEGAIKKGKTWLIPSDTQKPADARFRENRAKEK